MECIFLCDLVLTRFFYNDIGSLVRAGHNSPNGLVDFITTLVVVAKKSSSSIQRKKARPLWYVVVQDDIQPDIGSTIISQSMT